MSFSQPIPKSDNLPLTQTEVTLIKKALKNESSAVFSRFKLTELIKQKLGMDIDIDCRILKVAGDENQQDQYYAIGKTAQEGTVLGHGADGKVKKVINIDNGKPFALKAIKITIDELDKIKIDGKPDKINMDAKEVQYELKRAKYQWEILHELGDTRAEFLQKSVSDNDDKVRSNHVSCYILLDFIEGKNLLELLQEQVEEKNGHLVTVYEWIDICYSIVNEVAELHKHHVLHRDLKLENIMYDRNTQKAKIIDFGVACFCNSDNTVQDQAVVGTKPYISPEVVDRQFYSEKSEVYALGQIFQEILGFESFENSEECLRNSKTYFELSQLNILNEVEELINSMLEFDFDNRFSIREIQEELATIKKAIEFSCISTSSVSPSITLPSSLVLSTLSPSLSSVSMRALSPSFSQSSSSISMSWVGDRSTPKVASSAIDKIVKMDMPALLKKRKEQFFSTTKVSSEESKSSDVPTPSEEPDTNRSPSNKK